MNTRETLLQKVRVLNNEDKFQEVIDTLLDDILDNYNSADLYVEKAKAFYLMNQVEESKKMAEKALLNQPNHARGNQYLGNWYYHHQKYDMAIEHYEKAIAVFPNDFNLIYELGNAYLLKKEFDKAIEYYKKGSEIYPNSAIFYNGIGNTYFGSNQNDKAIIYYLKAIVVNPDLDAPYYNIGQAYRNVKNYKEALKAFEKKIALTINNPDNYTLLASEYIAEIKKITKNDSYYQLREIVIKIKNLLHFKEGCITHYTSLSTAKSIFFNGSPFRLSEGAFLNDTSEGRELDKYLEYQYASQNKYGTVAEPFSRKPFIGSFVKENKHDDLTLWRMYGKEAKEEAKGCAITLDVKKLKKQLQEVFKAKSAGSITGTLDSDFKFYKVAYQRDGAKGFILPGAKASEVVKLNAEMKKLKLAIAQFKSSKQGAKEDKKLSIAELLNEITYLFKAVEYEYEHEIRLVVDSEIGFTRNIITTDEAPKVYIEIGDIRPIITKITLGPKVERSEEWASVFYYSFKEFYKEDFTAIPEIYISHLPFK